MEVRQATYSDIDALMALFEGAKRIMRESGNHSQWSGAYPSKEIVLADIAAGYCHVLCDAEEIIATMALIPGPDPTYTKIDGEWPDDDPYYVIHRMAASAPGRNVAKTMFDWAFAYIDSAGCRTVRIDTHRDNVIMKHILNKYGFTSCGVIWLADGAPRDAYLKHKQVL